MADETDDNMKKIVAKNIERKVTYVKFPKVSEEKWHPVEIDFYKSESWFLVLHRQIIAGVKIPSGSEIHIDVEKFCRKSNKMGCLNVPGWAVNKLIKALFVMNLKNNPS